MYQAPDKVHKFGQDIQPEQLRYHHKSVLLTKEFVFDSAHHLYEYDGKCKSLHGHTYKLQVTVKGKLDARGIALDFGDIKRITNERIVDRLDHQYLNAILPPMNTTAENMVVWMFEQIHDAFIEEGLAPDIQLEEVRLWETPTSFAMVNRALMEEID
jgi:6-pyruvoyltetrahydropterin/6-carboxytetrahydropterin synthase